MHIGGQVLGDRVIWALQHLDGDDVRAGVLQAETAERLGDLKNMISEWSDMCRS